MARVAILLTEGFADWEYALIAGTGLYYGIDVEFFAPGAGQVRSQGGLTAVVSRDFGGIAAWRPDVVVAIGGTIWETAAAPRPDGLLRDQYDRGAAVAGICGGTLALARAGLLDRVAHTSNDLDFLLRNAREYAGSGRYVQSATAVSDCRLITASGAAPVSFAAAVLAVAGVDGRQIEHFRTMLAAEHRAVSAS